MIVGADGLHSNVRTLTFGPESGFSTWIGGYLSVISVPEYLAFNGVMQVTAKVGRSINGVGRSTRIGTDPEMTARCSPPSV